MFAMNISVTLLCEECGEVMSARTHQKHSKYAYWECFTSYCVNEGKLFRHELEVIELTEVEHDDL